MLQCIGAVVDIQFPRDSDAKGIYEALQLDASEENPLVEKPVSPSKFSNSSATARRAYHCHGLHPTASAAV